MNNKIRCIKKISYFSESCFCKHNILVGGLKISLKVIKLYDYAVSYSYSKIVQSDHYIHRIWCSDWMFFEYKYKADIPKFMILKPGDLQISQISWNITKKLQCQKIQCLKFDNYYKRNV
jgi:hypothetical protein